MAGFGRFESVSELASSGPFTVFAARLAGQEGDPAFAVKTFRAQDDLADPEMLERRAALFVEGARLQQALAKAAPGAWAPIHELGRTEQFAYYVTDLFPLSCQKLIDLRREVSPAQACRIVVGAATGLAALRAHGHGRGHGDFKPSNVLLRAGDDGDLDRVEVFLTDPLPDARVDASAQAQDQRELADVLHQLIVLRPAPKGGAIQRGPEWARWGPQGEELRKACEWLLNPQAGTALPTPEEIAQRLEQVTRAKGAKRGKGPLLGALAAVIVLGAGGAAWMFLKPAPPPPPPPPPPIDDPNGGGEPVPVVITDTTKDQRDEKWKSATTASFEKIRAAIELARVRLTDEGSEIATKDLGEVTEKAAALVAKYEGILAAAWDKVPADDPGPDPANPAMRAVTKEEHADIVRRINEVNSEVFQLPKRISQVTNQSAARLAEFVDAQRKPEALVAVAGESEPLRRAFLAEVKRLAKLAETPGELTWAKAKGDVEAARAWLKRVDDGLPKALTIRQPGAGAVNVDAVTTLFAQRREDALRLLVAPVADEGKPVPAEGDGAFEALAKAERDKLAGLGVEAERVLGEAAAMESLLSLGFSFDEAGPGGKSVQALAQSIADSPLIDLLRPGVEGVLGRASDLRRVGTLSDPAALLNEIKSGGPDAARVSAVMVAWRRLPAAGFPANVGQLGEAARLLKDVVTPALAKVQDAKRREAMQQEAGPKLREMWFTFARDRAGGDPAVIDTLFRSMPDMGIAPGDLATLGPWAVFNYARWQAIPQVRGVSAPDAKGQVAALQPIVSGFWQKPEVAAVLGVGAVAKMREDLRKIEEGKPPLDFAQEGPGRAGWSGSAPEDGLTATYTKGGNTLVFRRVNSPDADRGSYVCTTEVSLGLFNDLLTDGDRWGELGGIMRKGSTDTGRLGPCVWKWGDDGRSLVASPPEPDTGNGWFTFNSGLPPGMSYYPAGVNPPAAPTRECPVNYVSPHAAVMAARAANCRIPTSQEWTAAAASGAGDTNLRDAGWASVHAHIRQLNQGDAQGRARIPNGDIFRPVMSGIDAGQDANPAPGANDSILWFRPVGSGASFRDLVGNVAEFVFDNSPAMEALPPKPSKDEMVAFFRQEAAAMGVVGGSALSPDAPTTPVKPERIGTTLGGYSDVGFRLAFSTGAGGGGGKPLEKVDRAFALAPYLTKDSK